VLRMAVGSCMVYAGYGKVIPTNALDHYAHYIVTLGMPYWLGYVSALTEFAGGILVLLGLLTRPAAALIGINMIVAMVKVSCHQGAVSIQFVGLLIAAAIALLCIGGGIFAVDRKIGFA